MSNAHENGSQPAGRVPARRYFGESMNMLISALYARFQEEEGGGASTLLGFQVPDFQRDDSVWSRDQQIALIEALYEGANVGAFMVNLPGRATDETWNVLLDGLQRLTALKSYWQGKFALVGADGNAYMWSDLQASERANLLRITMPYVTTQFTSRDDMARAYNRHNFSGTPHDAAQRAQVRGP